MRFALFALALCPALVLAQGQDFAFRISASRPGLSVLVIDPQGRISARLQNGADFIRLRLPETGDYTFVVQGPAEGGEYKFKWIDLDAA